MVTVTPAFKPHVRIVVVPGEGVLALTEGAAWLRRGAHFARICALIDGRRRAEEIVEAVVDEVNPALAWSVLMKLETVGWIEESNNAVTDRRHAAFWLTLGVDPQRANAVLEAADIRIYATSTDLAERFDAALAQFGMRASRIESVGAPRGVEAGGAPSGLDVVLVDDYLSEALRHHQKFAQAAGRRWLLLCPCGATPWIGPLFSPGDAPCPDCLRLRLSRQRASHAFARRYDPEGGTAEPLGALPGTEALACLMAAAEVAKVLTGGPTALAGIVKTLDLRDFSSRGHQIVPHPTCENCAAALGFVESGDAPAPIEIRPLPIRFSEGGYRSVTPEETLRAYERLLSPIGGIIGALTPNTPPNAIGHMYVATEARPFAAPPPAQMEDLRYRFRHSSVGKGMTQVQAKASALCEAVERYSAMRQGTEVIHAHAYSEITADAIHPNAVMGYSERQYATRREVNFEKSRAYLRVPAPLDPHERIEWTPVWSLTGGRRKLLPTELLYIGKARERAVAFGDSNGCAAGNNLEEAILQGFLELVERDAVAIWWYNRLVRPAVDLHSFADHWLQDLPGRYRALDRELTVVDLTNDLGIPVVAAISHRASGKQERIAIGLGCHLDPAIAVQRAVTEVVQMLDVDLTRGDAAVREFAGGWMEWATRVDHAYLAPDETAPARRLEDFPRPRFDDLQACIAHCRKVVESRGMEMLVLDLTRQDTRLPVARVIVPGLRHFWPRFAPGRLFEMPVALGWRASATPEPELNPTPVFF